MNNKVIERKVNIQKNKYTDRKRDRQEKRKVCNMTRK